MVLFVFLIFTVHLYAQGNSGEKTTDNTSSVIIHKDARLDLLMKKQAEINEITSREARRTSIGYRLMIITTINRDEAISAKTKVYTHFPELKAYLWYQSPYYKLKAGDFKERKDAELYQKKLNSYFPKGVFILSDVIEVKPDKDMGNDNK